MKETNFEKDFAKLRQRTGLTQTEFSKIFKVPKRTIENWESGKSRPRDYQYMYLKDFVERWIENGKKPPQ